MRPDRRARRVKIFQNRSSFAIVKFRSQTVPAEKLAQEVQFVDFIDIMPILKKFSRNVRAKQDRNGFGHGTR
jgi:hypothetical protein